MPNELGALPFDRGFNLQGVLETARLLGEFTEFVIRNRQSRVIEARVFIVHGHDDGAREGVARYIERLGLDTVVLQESANYGQTIVEKLEANANVGYAVILMTPDDVGFVAARPQAARPRARQNVVFEAGYFVGRLGRRRVCLLHKGDLEMPTDLSGVVYLPLDAHGGWQAKLAAELQDAGFKLRRPRPQTTG